MVDVLQNILLNGCTMQLHTPGSFSEVDRVATNAHQDVKNAAARNALCMDGSRAVYYFDVGREILAGTLRSCTDLENPKNGSVFSNKIL